MKHEEKIANGALRLSFTNQSEMECPQCGANENVMVTRLSNDSEHESQALCWCTCGCIFFDIVGVKGNRTRAIVATATTIIALSGFTKDLDEYPKPLQSMLRSDPRLSLLHEADGEPRFELWYDPVSKFWNVITNYSCLGDSAEAFDNFEQALANFRRCIGDLEDPD